MGGYGRERWHWYIPKRTVEQCLSVDAAALKKEITCIYRGDYSEAVLPWSVSGRMQGTLRIVLQQGWRGGVVMYLYFMGDSQRAAETIFLQTTAPHYGGLRWWFTCPFPRCSRRARKLYLPPGCGYFGCRHCLDLTYQSCQESGDRTAQLSNKVTRLKHKLGARGYDTAPAAPIPPKPKDMRWKTYQRWVGKLREAEWELCGAMQDFLERLKR